MSYKSLEQIGTAQVSFHFAVTPGKTECLSNPNSEYCCPKGMVGRPASLEPNGYRFEYTRIGMPTSSNTKQKNMSETTTLAKNPYCSSCSKCGYTWACSIASSGLNSQCKNGIATLKNHGWPIPSVSQTGATMTNYPCCYLRDMWCTNTAQQDDKFKDMIDHMNSLKGYNFGIKKHADSTICQQIGCS